MFGIRLLFNSVPTATTLTFESDKERDKIYAHFQQLMRKREVFYNIKFTINFAEVRMIERLSD